MTTTGKQVLVRHSDANGFIKLLSQALPLGYAITHEKCFSTDDWSSFCKVWLLIRLFWFVVRRTIQRFISWFIIFLVHYFVWNLPHLNLMHWLRLYDLGTLLLNPSGDVSLLCWPVFSQCIIPATRCRKWPLLYVVKRGQMVQHVTAISRWKNLLRQ